MGRHYLSVILVLGLVGPGCANDPPSSPPTLATASTERKHPTFAASDVVVAIDQSTLGLLASGVDVDDDGRVGRTRIAAIRPRGTPLPERFFTSDPDDTVHRLQLRVARALVPALAARHTRLGLVAFALRDRGLTHARFADKPAIVVPVGPAEAVLAALENFPATRKRRHTDLARLLELAAKQLDAVADEPDRTSTRAILLLSHGQPSAPDGIHWASRRAIEVAREIGQRNIEIWAVPFGIANAEYLEELTQASGGSVVPLDRLHAQFGPASP